MIIRASILVIFVLASFVTNAQEVKSEKDRFSIQYNKGCNPFTVTLNAPECHSGGLSCSAKFADGTLFGSVVNGSTFTYTTPGTYTIEVIFGSGENNDDQLSLEVTPNIAPEFDVYACSGNEVQVKINDTNYNQYIIDYNGTEVTVPGGSLAKDNQSFTSTISVRGQNTNSADNCSSTSKTITSLPALTAPVITALNVQPNGDITLDFDTQQNILYKLEVAVNNATTFQPLRNIYNTTSAPIANLKPDENYYCFRLGTFDPCNNTTTYSNTICSAKVDLTITNNRNRFAWVTSITGVSNFGVIKNSGTPIDVALAANYDDTSIQCGTEYCYQIITNYPNGAVSRSLTKCGKAISTNIPLAVENISSVVSNENVDIIWAQPTGYTAQEYSVFKSNNSNYSLLNTTTATAYTDTPYSSETETCYKISYTDVCGNKSNLSNAACPIILTGNLTENNFSSLSWTLYNGWKNGVKNYTIEKYDFNNQLLQVVDAAGNSSFLDDVEDFNNQVYYYRIIAYPNDALQSSVSNTIKIVKEPTIFYPTAFTPNGDGLNDKFLVFGRYTAEFEMKIFNRWGEMLFITDNLEQGWDGTYKGNKMPEGTYVFRAKLKDFIGRTFDRSGTVVLLNK